MSRYYIGLSSTGHDPAFAVVDASGQVLFAEATERYLQDKRGWGAAPDLLHHIEPILTDLVANDSDAEFVIADSWLQVKNEQPVAIRELLVEGQFLRWIGELQASIRTKLGSDVRLLMGDRIVAPVQHFEHHLCHAAAALYSAPFDDGLCLVVDGEGEVGSLSLYQLQQGHLKRLKRSWGPGSLGSLYIYLTELCGFSARRGEEWKVMGLAAYGQAQSELVDDFKQLLMADGCKLRVAEDPQLTQIKTRLARYQRADGEDLMSAADLACSGQQAYQQLLDSILHSIDEDYPSQARHLILTGGCALNSLYNGQVRRTHGLQQLHVPSAPADDGNAMGAALLAWQQDHPTQALPHANPSPYLGSTINSEKLLAVLCGRGVNVTQLDAHTGGDFIAQKLAAGLIIGVARGRAEFGPRALGNRSILADPRQASMKARVNAIVKGREAYRPFAPAIPEERLSEWFVDAHAAPYMSYAFSLQPQQQQLVPAVVHADGTGRVQTVSAQVSPWFHKLLTTFEQYSGVPVLLNTSFNVMGKPIVHSAEDALAVLMSSGLDAVLLNDLYIEK